MSPASMTGPELGGGFPSHDSPADVRAVSDPHAEPPVTGASAADFTVPDDARRIKDLPRELGVMLMTVGVLGFALPGIVGTPALIAGGLVLWPNTFGKVERWFERRYPRTHRQSLVQISRYLNDLENRYPDASPP